MKGYTIFESFSLLRQLVSKSEFISCITAQSLSSAAVAYYCNVKLSEKVNEYISQAYEIIPTISSNPSGGEIFYTLLKQLSFYYIAGTLLDTINSIVTACHKELICYLTNVVISSLLQKIYSEQNSIILSANKETKELVPNIHNYAYTLAESLSNLTVGLIKSSIQLSFSIYTIYNVSGRFITIPIVVGLTTCILKSILHNKSSEEADKSERTAQKLASKLKTAMDYSLDIYLNDKGKTEEQSAESLNSLSFLQNQSFNRLTAFSNLLENAVRNIQYPIQFGIFGYQLYIGKVTLGQLGPFGSAINNMNQFFDFISSAPKDIEKLRVAIRSIGTILSVMAKGTRNGFDRAESSTYINIRNIEFKINDKIINDKTGEEEDTSRSFKFSGDITLKKGSRCIISAGSGCGKSTFIGLLFGASPGDHITNIKGNTSLPRNNKVACVSQSPFIQENTTIRAFFKGPNNDRLNALLQTAGLDKISRDRQCRQLSGGQKQRLLLTEAILKQPELLVLDESFSGLDDESKIIMENMIKKELPDCIILSAMHAEPDSFYTHQLSFVKKTEYEIDLQFKEIVNEQRK